MVLSSILKVAVALFVVAQFSNLLNAYKLEKRGVSLDDKTKVPKFLTSLTPEQKKELLAIKANKNLTQAQLHEEVKKWIDKQPENIKSDFEQFQKEVNEMKIKLRDKILAKLSPEGKEVFGKLGAILENTDLTSDQICEQLDKTIDAASDAVKNELHFGEPLPDKQKNLSMPPITMCSSKKVQGLIHNAMKVLA